MSLCTVCRRYRVSCGFAFGSDRVFLHSGLSDGLVPKKKTNSQTTLKIKKPNPADIHQSDSSSFINPSASGSNQPSGQSLLSPVKVADIISAAQCVWSFKTSSGSGRGRLEIVGSVEAAAGGVCGVGSQTERDVQRWPKKIVLPVWMPAELRNHVINI